MDAEAEMGQAMKTDHIDGGGDDDDDKDNKTKIENMKPQAFCTHSKCLNELMNFAKYVYKYETLV